MKNIIFNLLILFSIIFISFINISCDGPIGPVSDITGKIYSQSHFPAQNLKVSSQGKSTFTKADGSYSLEGINFPYDLAVIDSAYRYNTYIYKGINVNFIEIPFSEYYSTQPSPILKVTIPEEILQPDIECKVIFSDGKYINVYKNYYATDKYIYIDIPFSNEAINGKLYVLTYKYDSDYNILSYENYGVSPELNVQSGTLTDYSFTQEQLSFNPGEKVVDCRIESTNNSFLINSCDWF